MAFEAGSVVAKFIADVTGFKAGAKQVADDTKKLKSGFTDAGTSITKMAGVFGVALGAAGVVGFLKSSIQAFEESERVMAQTNAVIKSTGMAAGFTAGQISDMAKHIQQTTPISDEAAQSGMNMLLTFTNIGHDTFPRATQAMIDMATAMNGGITPSAEQLSNTAIQLGKALQDPILGVSALRRVGVNFNETQQDMIKHLVETGHTMEAQKYILKELETEFGGSAAAQLDTFGGRLQYLQNQFNDLQEKIGGALVPAISYLIDSMAAGGGAVNYLAVPFQVLGSIIIGLIMLCRQLGIAISTVAAGVIAMAKGDMQLAKQVVIEGMTDMFMEGVSAQQKLTNVWGTQTQKQTDYTKKAFDQQGQASSKASQKIQKDLEEETRKFKEEMDKRKADYIESLADLVHAHQDKVKDLEKQISDENKDFQQNLDDRKQTFDDRMSDLKATHQDKVDTIVAQIAEETAKGADADQKQIADLQAKLDAENAAYDAQVAKDTAREQQEIDRLKRDHDQKVADTQAQLNAEKAILDAHQAEVAMVKDKAREDDIARLTRQFNEENAKATEEHNRRMVEIAQRGDALGGTLGSNINAGLGAQAGAINDTMKDIASKSGATLTQGITDGAREAGHGMVTSFVNGVIDKAKEALKFVAKVGVASNPMLSALAPFLNLPHFASGVANFRGGYAMVGELGPEMVRLPGGSDVIPNDKLGGNVINLTIDMEGAIIADEFGAQSMAEKFGDKIIKKLQANIRF